MIFKRHITEGGHWINICDWVRNDMILTHVRRVSKYYIP